MIPFRPAFLLISLFLLITPGSVFGQWKQTNGPEGISISSMETIDGIVYAGTRTNGVYISEDDGLSWEARNNGIENTEITAFTCLGSWIFAGTFGGGVFRTEDGGQSWLPPAIGNHLYVESLTRKDSVLFAGGVSNGLHRSLDTGKTWTEIIPGYAGVAGPLGSNAEYVIANVSLYTYISDDYGDTWDEIENLAGESIFSCYTEDSLVLLGGRNSIHKSTDYGNSFISIEIDFPYSLVNLYDISVLDGSFYIGTSYDGVHKSDDDGFNWTAANQGMGPKDVRAIARTDSSSLLAGSIYAGVYRSIDSAGSWVKSVEGFPAGSTIACMLHVDSSVYAGTRDGVYRTDDDGFSWIKLKGGNDTVNYSLVRGLCEKDGLVYAGMSLQFSATVYKTADQGESWERCGNGLPDLSFINGLVSLGGNIVAATDIGIYYSEDDGESWNLSGNSGGYVYEIAASEDHAYAPLSGIGIYRSSDYGESWSPVLPSSGVDFISIAAKDQNAFAGSFFHAGIYSHNDGLVWDECSGFPGGSAVFDFGPFGDGYVLAATDDASSIWISYDHGISFQPYSESLRPNTTAEAFAIGDTYMFAGTDYNGVWRRLRPELVQTNPVSDLNEGLKLWQNNPNPFSNSTEIRYSIPAEGFVSLAVFDLQGRKIQCLHKGRQPAGEYRTHFQAGNLQSGLYLIKLNYDQQSSVKKIMLTNQ